MQPPCACFLFHCTVLPEVMAVAKLVLAPSGISPLSRMTVGSEMERCQRKNRSNGLLGKTFLPLLFQARMPLDSEMLQFIGETQLMLTSGCISPFCCLALSYWSIPHWRILIRDMFCVTKRMKTFPHYVKEKVEELSHLHELTSTCTCRFQEQVNLYCLWKSLTNSALRQTLKNSATLTSRRSKNFCLCGHCCFYQRKEDDSVVSYSSEFCKLKPLFIKQRV